MSKLKCNISEDLMPLYIEDILSEESKKDMELHLEECENCKKIYNELKEDVNLEYEKNIDLKEDEYENLKTDTLDSIKNYLNKIKYNSIFILLWTAVGLFLASSIKNLKTN